MTAAATPPPGEASAPLIETPPARGEARPFVLGQESFRAAPRLAGLERIGERLARRIRSVVEPYAHVRARATAEPVETLRFETFRADLPSFVSLSLYRLQPLKGNVLIVIEPDFVARMVDAFYGGTGAARRARGPEFTPSEERVLTRLADAVVEKLVGVWGDVVPLTASLVSRETNAAYARLVRGDETVVVQRIAVVTGQSPIHMLSVVYPLAALRPYEAQLAGKVHAEAGPVDADWRGQIAEVLETVQLPVRSVLARPELSVAQVMALRPGDVIPITIEPKVPLIVANRRLASGTIGEREGRAALMIDHIEQGNSR
jgi:flagellar motor switch protein FliM